jgi:glycosyltransferase involved in cell wall biosynthesis
MTADSVGGVWTYALELGGALGRRGVQVTLATMGGRLRADQERELRGAGIGRVHVGEFALEWMDEPWEDVDRAGDWLLRIADDVEPDVVHLNGYSHACLPWPAPVVVAGHSDVLSWHEAVRGAAAGPEWDRYRDAVGVGLAAADLLAAPTRALLRALVRLHEPRCPTRVIPNGLDRRPPVRPKEPLVLGAGRLWDEAKNAASLVRVAPRLPWPVALAGDGEVGDGVRALGRLDREQMDDAFARAAIFAAPARYEPFGLAVLEAARGGCALVLGDIPSLREVWRDAAIYVRPDDHAALERQLGRLIEDDELRADYAHRALARSEVFTAGRMADAHLDAYRAVTRRRAAA